MTNSIAWGESSAIQEFPGNISKNPGDSTFERVT